MSDFTLHCGDAIQVLKTLPDESVQCCVTSPPYWGLRNYNTAEQVWGGEPAHVHVWGDRHFMRDVREETESGKSRTTDRFYGDESRRFNGNHQKHIDGAFCECGAWRGSLGLEPTPELYVSHLVAVFHDVKRVLRSDGAFWLNLGDCYATGAGKVGDCPGGGEQGERWKGFRGDHVVDPKRNSAAIPMGPQTQPNRMPIPGLKPKDLVGIPWMTAFALRLGGWYLRAENIWAKTNCMPESIVDRTTRSHEQLFLFAKSERYFYDAAAIAEPCVTDPNENYPGRAYITGRGDQDAALVRGNDRGKSGGFPPRSRDNFKRITKEAEVPGQSAKQHREDRTDTYKAAFRNKRSVWTIATSPYPDAHFAVMPEALVEPCILAGTRPGDLVLDPFCGAGTVGAVSLLHNRNFIGIDLNPEYLTMARGRLYRASSPLLGDREITQEIAI